MQHTHDIIVLRRYTEMMTIARAIFASLATVPLDIESNPEKLRFEGCGLEKVGVMTYAGRNYSFRWEIKGGGHSQIDLIQEFTGWERYFLYDGIPHTKQYGNITNTLSHDESQNLNVALDFIRDAIKKAGHQTGSLFYVRFNYIFSMMRSLATM